MRNSSSVRLSGLMPAERREQIHSSAPGQARAAKVGRASCLPREPRKRRALTDTCSRLAALAGQAGRLPYFTGRRDLTNEPWLTNLQIIVD
jgi:hypothetical protein